MVEDAHEDLSKAIILVIDDDAAVRNSLKFLLELEGFEVRLYASGSALLNERDLPSDVCVVIDQVVPGLSGLETIDLMRRGGLNCPAVLVISTRNVEVRDGARRRGIAIVKKPFLQQALLDAIAAARNFRAD
jgi:two-component system, LuxR family, response regulator FixJ